MKRQLRVLLLFPHYNTLNEASSLRSPQVASYLKSKGYDVTVIAPGVDMRTGKLFPELKGKSYLETIVDGVRLIRPKCIEDFRRSMMRRLLFEFHFAFSVVRLFFFIKRPDVVMGAYPPAILPFLGLLISKLRGIPFVFEVRDLMADALAKNKYSKSRLLNKIAAFLENLAYRYSNHIVTVSDGIKKMIIEKGYPAEKITPVKNGYEPQVFEQADYTINPRKEFGWGEKFVVIYAGGLTQSYDIPTLLKVAELSKGEDDILFVIIGEGDKKEEYKEYCRKQGLQNVQIMDVLPRKMMPAILSGANVGVHLFPNDPLWGYVLGNKPFDYLGSGIPMIYSGTGDTADLVINSGGGFVVTPEQPKEFLKKVLWLRDHPKESKEKGLRGKAYVKSEFNRFKLLEPLDSVMLLFCI